MSIFGRSSAKKDEKKAALSVLRKEDVLVQLPSVDKYEAIRMAGRMLVKNGCVTEEYIEAMIERENTISTYIGEGVAIPHGVGSARQYIQKTGIVVLQFKDGVEFGDEKAYVLVGIAGLGDGHLPILQSVARIMLDEELMDRIRTTDSADFIYASFTGNE